MSRCPILGDDPLRGVPPFFGARPGHHVAVLLLGRRRLLRGPPGLAGDAGAGLEVPPGLLHPAPTRLCSAGTKVLAREPPLPSRQWRQEGGHRTAATGKYRTAFLVITSSTLTVISKTPSMALGGGSERRPDAPGRADDGLLFLRGVSRPVSPLVWEEGPGPGWSRLPPGAPPDPVRLLPVVRGSGQLLRLRTTLHRDAGLYQTPMQQRGWGTVGHDGGIGGDGVLHAHLQVLTFAYMKLDPPTLKNLFQGSS